MKRSKRGTKEEKEVARQRLIGGHDSRRLPLQSRLGTGDSQP